MDLSAVSLKSYYKDKIVLIYQTVKSKGGFASARQFLNTIYFFLVYSNDKVILLVSV